MKLGKLGIYKRRRRADQRTWFSVSPLIVSHWYATPDEKVCGFGVYGPNTGIIIDWMAFYGR